MKHDITFPLFVRATVCIPPHSTCTISRSSSPFTMAGFFLSKISSPKPNCPTSPCPSVKTCPVSLRSTLAASVIKQSYCSNNNNFNICDQKQKKSYALYIRWFKENQCSIVWFSIQCCFSYLKKIYIFATHEILDLVYCW